MYKTRDSILLDINLIFPLLLTETCFPFAIDTRVGVESFSKLYRLVILLVIWSVTLESMTQKLYTVLAIKAILKALKITFFSSFVISE